ncbi:MAG: type phosphodiesterase/nucleotide pyrophosphatase [Proteobacteria bacterium]|nr:type phosphodiesterase/nucleotide pyrophosphatase [Pseudomonadota bacterium]
MTSIALPNYRGQGIVNLVQSIATACGSTSARYPELDALPAAALGEARHIVLLVIDGLGERTLARHPASPNLQRHAIANISSVFPSTTASAITTFMTGLAPAQHGLTGWHIYLEEIGQTLAILPLTARGAPSVVLAEALPPRLFAQPTLFEQLARECWVVTPRSIAGSPFNARHSRGATSLAYDSLGEMFGQIAGLLRDAKAPRYIYAYYSDLDSESHRHGTDSEPVRQTLAALDDGFGELWRDAQGSDSWLIATADHGFIDSPPPRVVSLDDHPQLAALLARPLCGERRAAYCYVAPENRAAFAAYIAAQLAHCVDLRDSAELITAGWFGPPPYHPRLAARVGDYTLVMKDDWTIKDQLPGEKQHRMLGVHGGVSGDEMLVPLIAVRV